MDKLKHSFSASLSVALAFLFPMYFGIEDTSSAAITVMVIAASDSLNTSVLKGFYRVLGTFFGAIIGITLISLFPQERILYLIVLSIAVTITLYIARAYKGDKTIFLLTAMTMMIVFDGGNTDDVFLYATEKTIMTMIGIFIYTFMSIYIFANYDIKNEGKEKFGFIWFDTEDIKGAIISFCVFWVSVFIWIYFAIPYGFFITVLATSLSLFTAYSIVKPYVLIILYSLSFIFAIIAYIFILPNLDGWWSLGIFIFLYSFFGFYFIPAQISIFYLLGMATFLIENEMNFNFAVFMFVLLIFYLFLFVLLLLDYFPFNQKSEHMFLQLNKKFLKIFKKNPTSKHLPITIEKMKLYATKIDYNYFGIEKETLIEYCKICEEAFKENNINKLYNYDINLNKLKESRF
jgi:hypothetical protein